MSLKSLPLHRDDDGRLSPEVRLIVIAMAKDAARKDHEEALRLAASATLAPAAPSSAN